MVVTISNVVYVCEQLLWYCKHGGLQLIANFDIANLEACDWLSTLILQK